MKTLDVLLTSEIYSRFDWVDVERNFKKNGPTVLCYVCNDATAAQPIKTITYCIDFIVGWMSRSMLKGSHNGLMFFMLCLSSSLILGCCSQRWYTVVDKHIIFRVNTNECMDTLSCVEAIMCFLETAFSGIV